MISTSNARYINHSCSPNCVIDDTLNVVSISPIKKGEELTICYNLVHPWEKPGPWDDRWSFQCGCRSSCCQQMVDRYVNIDGSNYLPSVTGKRKVNQFNQ